MKKTQDRLLLISGPCVIESLDHALQSAEFLTRLLQNKPLSFIFKSSYDKANRTSLESFRGPGVEQGLKILEKVKQEFNVPVLTDVHTVEEISMARQVVDIIQIPAFLCRQTDLLVAAAKSGCIVNVKKGQFVSPWDMQFVVEKLEQSGAKQIFLTERGTCFGYQNLVTDFRSIPVMQQFGHPVIFDATHSVQLPGAAQGKSGGQKEFIATLCKAAIAAGCNGIFAESHLNPELAKSDAATQIAFNDLNRYVDLWIELFEFIQEHQCVEKL